MDLNRATIIGRLTQDPESRTTPQGSAVASFSVATNFVWTDGAGQKQEKVEYHNIVAWRKLAEICTQYLKKGSKVFLEGRLQTRDWEGQDGVKRFRTEIIADNMIMLDRAGGAPSMPTGFVKQAPTNDVVNTVIPAADKSAYASPASVDRPSEDEIKVEDIPF
jgi:single-strand DNA-binding protein